MQERHIGDEAGLEKSLQRERINIDIAPYCHLKDRASVSVQYSRDDLRDPPKNFFQRFFQRLKDKYFSRNDTTELQKELKEYVTLSKYNAFDPGGVIKTINEEVSDPMTNQYK